jgi:hypothetical protein
MKKRIAVVMACCVAVTGPALAILGIGDIVYDPTNFEEAVQQLAALAQQYQQLVMTYDMIKSQYEEMVRMGSPVPVLMSLRYRALSTPWTLPNATNTYGTTAGWTAGITTGSDVAGGYRAAAEPLGVYGGAFSNIPADQAQRVKTNYATVELTDAANLAAMQTIGDLRARAQAVEEAIQNLEDDSLSSDLDMNTELAVLNKMNAAGVIALRNGQDTNKLLVSLAESRILEAKRMRDAEARAFNEHIGFVSDGQNAMAAQAANASAAMLAWRMP